MSHEIESFAFAGAPAWHGLGNKVDEADIYDWPTFCQKAGLDWEAELVPLMTADQGILVSGCKAVRRTSDSKILGTVGDRYTILQNRQVFNWFQPFLASREASLHTAGSLRGGSRIFALAKLNRDPLVIIGDDIVDKYLLLSHSHDGSLAVRVGFTPIRVVCQNTLSLAHGDKASKLIRLKHSRDVQQNLENIRGVIDAANATFEATADQYRLLVRKTINRADLRKYVKLVLGVDEEGGLPPSTKMENMIRDVIYRCESGRGNTNPNVSGTLWTAYNGFNEWLAHKRGRSEDSRLDSLWFGEAAKMNERAFEIALNMAV